MNRVVSTDIQTGRQTDKQTGGHTKGLTSIVVTLYPHKDDLAGWAHVFYLTAGIIMLATIFYLIFGSGKTQMWSNPTSNFCLVEKMTLWPKNRTVPSRFKTARPVPMWINR
ncbi:hypothetical protein DPMN_011131 [Dreissena polymorpha]|uniref:Uncharacterized protein n=1 Tax=Dreissena polymorpha TaxID=45954 RepID=A0A9D4RZY0_DREPO|nr:hypothetical protein DPMN_011131 [Dreissena polymorpha]